MKESAGSWIRMTTIARKKVSVLLRALRGVLPLLFLAACARTSQGIDPQVNYTIHQRYLQELPPAFAPLDPLEQSSDWGKEYRIGRELARSLDFYRAITAFRRAEILAPPELTARKLELQYEILLCYYLGKRYSDVDTAYQQSNLAKVDPTFPAFNDLLLILYDTYDQLGDEDKACYILELIEGHTPGRYATLSLSSAMRQGDIDTLYAFTDLKPERPYLDSLLACYEENKKSPSLASGLNAILPGAGYLYLGQTQTAITAFLMNGLFIASSVYFFQHGPLAAAIITTGFEVGWYIGGIQGASYQAKFYNERLYESTVTPVMNREKLFPVFMLQHSF